MTTSEHTNIFQKNFSSSRKINSNLNLADVDMPSRGKRKVSMADDDENAVKKHRSTSQSSLSKRSSRQDDSFNLKKCLTWFHEYTTPDEPETLGPDGMEKFCEDIGVEPENLVMLVLAWKMNAKQMGFFTSQEWQDGLSALRCDSITKLQNRLETLRACLADPATFKSIYRYAYDFARDKDQRCLEMETARGLLQLLLGPHWPLHTKFQSFLDSAKYKVMNKDQWYNVLEFSRTVQPDLSNYDVDGAWPVMLDEFVEWLKSS